MEKSIRTLQEALTVDLQRLYHGECQLRKNIPVVMESVTSHSLKEILSRYSESSEHKQLKIERMLSHLMSETRRHPNEIIHKMIEELRNNVRDCSDDIVDLMIIQVLQQLCCYKISVYRSAMILAMELDLEMVADLIQQVIEWERETDRLLMELAYQEFSKNGNAIHS